MLLAMLLFARLFWRLFNVKPRPEPTLKAYEIHAAEIVHWILYALPLAIMISGYLITTADGSSIDVFGLFEVPAIFPAAKGREEIAGDIHFYLAYATMGIVALHTLAALKHHFIDKDRTLLRMLKTTQK
jgi:cytochrome b561